MIAADPHYIVRVHQLQVGQRIVRGGDAVGRPCCLDRVNGGADRLIADGMDMHAETGQMESLDELENDCAVVLQLAARDLALTRMVAVLLEKCSSRGRGFVS